MPKQASESTAESARSPEVALEEAEHSAELHAARSLVNQFAAIQRLLKIYKPNNAAVGQAGDSFVGTLKTLLAGSPVMEMRFWRDCIFVNGNRLRCEVSTFGSYKLLLAHAARLEMEKIIIDGEVTRDQIIQFMSLLDSFASTGVTGAGIPERLASHDLGSISVVPSSQSARALEDLGLQALTNHERARRAFYAALGSAKELLLAQTSQAAVSLRKAKRAVQAAADVLLDDDSSVLALATIKDHDEYTFTHSVNVCIFSLAIGQRLGLHRSWLGRLGIAALFHDIGKVSVPAEVLNKVGILDVNEWKAIRKHTVMGVRKLSLLPRCTDQVLHSMIVAFQHHVNMDLSGYPSVPDDTSLDLFSRIVRIADTFDAMTTERPYRNKVYSPHDAIRYLVSQAGSKFDPVLVKAFASAMGLYPIGTVLRLNTGEVGIVLRRSELSGDLDRSMIRVILDTGGNQISEDRLIDLGESDPDTGEFIYSVVDTLSCKDLGVNPRDYILPKSKSS